MDVIRRPWLLLFLIGQNLMLQNYLLIRRMTASFADLETAALLTQIAYFTGVSLGYARASRVTLGRIRSLLPGFLVLQLGLILLGPLLAYRLEARSTALAYGVIFVLTALGSTSLYSVFLPSLVSGGEESMRRYYAAEVVGSLAGILLLPLLLGVDLRLVHAVYLVSFGAIAALLGARAPSLVALGALSVAFLFAAAPADRALSAAIYRQDLGDGEPVRVIHTRDSPYHKIEVIETARQERMLMLDGQLHFEPENHGDYSYFVAEYPARLLGRPTTCIAGCGSMSTVGRIGDLAPSITIVDLDPDVFETSRRFFADWNRLGELHNWSFQSDDAKHFFGTTQQRFDLVVDDIPPAKTRQVALTYTREFFALVRARLTPRGIFSLPSLVSVHARRRAYGRRILATLAAVFDQVFVLTVRGSSYFFATGTELALDADHLRAAIEDPDRDAIRILLPEDVKQAIRGIEPVTLNNIADLIEE